MSLQLGDHVSAPVLCSACICWPDVRKGDQELGCLREQLADRVLASVRAAIKRDEQARMGASGRSRELP
jgi:hypothetical protein